MDLYFLKKHFLSSYSNIYIQSHIILLLQPIFSTFEVFIIKFLKWSEIKFFAAMTIWTGFLKKIYISRNNFRIWVYTTLHVFNFFWQSFFGENTWKISNKSVFILNPIYNYAQKPISNHWQNLNTIINPQEPSLFVVYLLE